MTALVKELSRLLRAVKNANSQHERREGYWVVQPEVLERARQALEDANRAPAPTPAEIATVLRGLIANLARANTAEGVCCCGESAHHSPWVGHAPDDAGDYYAGRAIEAGRALLERITP